MKPFVVNRHGRLVFPANFLGDLDFSVLDTLDQFTAVIGRDFEAKAPTGTDILARVDSGAYPGRFELLRDLGQNLYWVNRYAITMFDKRPTRWRDLAKRRDDVFLPVLTPWEDSERKVAAVERAFRALPATWDADTENRVFDLLFDVFRTKLHHATELPAIKPTVAEFLAPARRADVRDARLRPGLPGLPDRGHPRCPRARPGAGGADALGDGAAQPVPVGPVPHRAARGGGDRRRRLRGRLPPAQPRRDGLHRAGEALASRGPSQREAPARAEAVEPVAPYPPVRVREAFAVQPKLEALAIVRGEHVCDNDDVIRNASFSWSPMSAEEISREDRHRAAPLHQPGA